MEIPFLCDLVTHSVHENDRQREKKKRNAEGDIVDGKIEKMHYRKRESSKDKKIRRETEKLSIEKNTWTETNTGSSGKEILILRKIKKNKEEKKYLGFPY